MNNSTYIISNWSQEVKRVQLENKKNKLERLAKWQEFKESRCDLFDAADFEYYAEVTGLKLNSILKHAKYSEDEFGQEQEFINSFTILESIY